MHAYIQTYINTYIHIHTHIHTHPHTHDRYKIGSTLPQRVGRLNPYWNEHAVNTDERFAKAMEMAGDEFLSVLNNYAKSWMPARTIVKQALDKRMEVRICSVYARKTWRVG